MTIERKIKNSPFEVLKLNRENKWQTRFLTVSKEGTWLRNGKDMSNGDACFCPLALLWVKKLTRSNDFSVTTIDKQGKGGIIFAHLAEVKVDNEWTNQLPLPKKISQKYSDSVTIRIFSDGDGKTNVTTLRCSRGTADNILLGCSAIIEVLRGGSRMKSRSQRTTDDKNMHKSSSEQYVNQQNKQQIGGIQGNSVASSVGSSRQLSIESSKNGSQRSGRVMANQTANRPVVAKNYAEQGAPHLWEA